MVGALLFLCHPSRQASRLLTLARNLTGLAAMIGIMVSLPVSGGHINPSVTVAFAVGKRMPWAKVPHYLIAQYTGAFLAGFPIWTLYHEHIDSFDSGRRSAFGLANSTGKIFTTFPAPTASLGTCIFDQVFMTTLLLIALCAIIDPKGMKIPVYLQPFIISLLIASLGVAFGYNSGGGINPGERERERKM